MRCSPGLSFTAGPAPTSMLLQLDPCDCGACDGLCACVDSICTCLVSEEGVGGWVGWGCRRHGGIPGVTLAPCASAPQPGAPTRTHPPLLVGGSAASTGAAYLLQSVGPDPPRAELWAQRLQRAGAGLLRRLWDLQRRGVREPVHGPAGPRPGPGLPDRCAGTPPRMPGGGPALSLGLLPLLSERELLPASAPRLGDRPRSPVHRDPAAHACEPRSPLSPFPRRHGPVQMRTALAARCATSATSGASAGKASGSAG